MILGRPFLATRLALIDEKDGELTLRVGDDKATCMRIDSLIPSRDGLMHEYMDRDPLEECRIHFLSTEEFKSEQVASNIALVETILTVEECEEAVVVEEKPITPDGLVLKELPTHFHYAFLGENSTKPVIILAALNDEMEKELLLILKRNI